MLDVTAQPSGDQLRRPVSKSSTQQFDCPSCGHRFRKRTKAGIYSRCPRCHEQAFGVTVRDRIIAGSKKSVELAEASRRRRSERRRAPAPGHPPS